MSKQRLFTPGPVEVPERVRAAMARPLIHHRTPEFSQIFADTSERLREVFGTRRPVVMFAASGSGALEAAVVNTMGQADHALTVEAGKFGERWGDLCQAYRLPHTRLPLRWGARFDLDRLAAALDGSPRPTVVCLTHSETSTGALIDLQAAAALCKRHGCRVVVDCVTSACAHPLLMDEWQLDMVVSGSQKGFMLPPGLAFLAVSEEAEAALESAVAPRFYFDVRAALRDLEKRSTPFTPAVSLIVGLAAALDMIFEEGLENVVERHATLGAACRAAAEAMGLRLFPETPSNIVTAVEAPEGIDADRVRKELEQDHGVKIAGGQGQLKGKILRVGHLGGYDATDILGAVSALERVLMQHGHPCRPGSAAGAASVSMDSQAIAEGA